MVKGAAFKRENKQKKLEIPDSNPGRANRIKEIDVENKNTCYENTFQKLSEKLLRLVRQRNTKRNTKCLTKKMIQSKIEHISKSR